MMIKTLIVIDYSNDFVATDGKLTCGEPGQAIERKIVELIESFTTQNELVLIDDYIHYENDPYYPDLKLFPPHNIVGTSGRELYGKVKTIF